MNSVTDNMVTGAFSPGDSFDEIHGIAAGILFLMLTIFSLFVFTATDDTNPYQRSGQNRNKGIRNFIYNLTGIAMISTLVLLAGNKVFDVVNCDIFSIDLGIGKSNLTCGTDNPTMPRFWDNHNLTFYFEWLALASFGVAWFVKGRGGGFLLLDESDTIFTKPWWWKDK